MFLGVNYMFLAFSELILCVLKTELKHQQNNNTFNIIYLIMTF